MLSWCGKTLRQLLLNPSLPRVSSLLLMCHLGGGFPRAALIGVAVALVVISLAACGNGPETQETAQATQYLRPMPTATAYPTATPYPTSTPYPTPTPVPAAKEPPGTPMPASQGALISKDDLSSSELFALISPSGAFIESKGRFGSGFLIDGGYIATNYHVVWPSHAVRVVFPDGTELEEVPVAAWDPMADLAVLGPVNVSAQPLSLVDGESTPVGSELFLIGYPDEVDHLFPQPTITRGILSNLREWEAGGITYLQTDHRIVGGQSGGVLVNSRGEVIGLTTYSFGGAQASLSASSTDIGPILEMLRQGEYKTEFGDRRLPEGDGSSEFEIALRNLSDTREFVFEVARGTPVSIEINGDGDGWFRVFDSFGLVVAEVDNGYTGIESAEVEITTSGVHFLQVGLAPGGEPSAFSVTSSVMLKPLADPDDGRAIAVGDHIAGSLDFPGDWDWYSIGLEKGDTVRVYADSLNVDTLLYVGPSGSEYYDFVSDDDSGGGLFGLNSEIVYRAPHTGEYLMSVTEAVENQSGGYYLSVETAPEGTPLTADFTLNQDSMSAESEMLINDFYDCLTTNVSFRQSFLEETSQTLQESGMSRDAALAVAESFLDDREFILSIMKLGIETGEASEFRDELSEHCDEDDPSNQHPAATATPAQVTQALLEYADRHAGGPGAIYVGDIEQLLGPAPKVDQGDFDGNVPLGALERHIWIYESPFYEELREKARLTDPTPITYDGEPITIEHVCISRTQLPCRLMESYLAPNLLERTNGKLKLVINSFPELGRAGPDTLSLVTDGTLDSATIYSGYVAGKIPHIEIQNLLGIHSSREQEFEASLAIIKDIEDLVLAETGGVIMNHSWLAGNDQFLFCRDKLETPADFRGKRIRSHSATLADWIAGMGADAQFVAFAEVYTAIERGILDCGVSGVDMAHGQRWYEVTDFMIGPLLSFPFNNNVINAEKWASIPEDLQQIILEEAARSELEALRVASIQNERGLINNTTERSAGQDAMEFVPFSDEMNARSLNTAVMEHVVPGWVYRVGDTSHPIITDTFNWKLGPIVGLRIEADGRVVRVPITHGPSTGQADDGLIEVAGCDRDRDVLVGLYEATNGENWRRKDNWLTDLPVGTWYGVAVDNHGCVTKLSLNDNQLSGGIPEDLASLSNLKRLLLNGNRLTGEIPHELGRLTGLEVLHLHFNDLTGEIPPELGDLAGLRELDLGVNDLTGEIPSAFGKLSNLTSLWLGWNNLSGEIPPGLGRLGSLTRLWLNNNPLEGCIPETLASQLDDLSNVGNLRNCGATPVSTATPSPMQVLSEREVLVALYHATDGANWRNNTNWLSDAPLDEWHHVSTDGTGRVTGLFLSDIQLSGEIPAELGGLAKLELLFLNDNRLSGEIPAELGDLASLTSLTFFGNELTGEIPPELGNLANLTGLILSYNELTGEIPPELGNLTNLETLAFTGNKLTGKIPAELGNLANLVWLELGGNRLSGEIPAELGDLASLTVLHLYENQLRGCVPTSLQGQLDRADSHLGGLPFC